MATIAGIISDTHGLMRPAALDALAGVAMILHAGDVGSSDVLDALAAIAPVRAVRGNVDTLPSLRPTCSVTIENARIFMLHNLAELDFDPAARRYHAVISGHSHRAREERRGGVLYLNPGAAGPRRFRLPITLALLHVDGSDLNVQVIPLAA